MMKYKFTDQDAITDRYGWVTLHVYEYINKGYTLPSIQKELFPKATKNISADSEVYTHIKQYITNTYNAFIDESTREQTIKATKAVCLILTGNLSKKVANTTSNTESKKLAFAHNELIRLAQLLNLYTDYIEHEASESNISYIEEALINEINDLDRKTVEGEVSVDDYSSLLGTIEITLQCREMLSNRKNKKMGLLTLTIIGLLIFIFV